MFANFSLAAHGKVGRNGHVAFQSSRDVFPECSGQCLLVKMICQCGLSAFERDGRNTAIPYCYSVSIVVLGLMSIGGNDADSTFKIG